MPGLECGPKAKEANQPALIQAASVGLHGLDKSPGCHLPVTQPSFPGQGSLRGSRDPSPSPIVTKTVILGGTIPVHEPLLLAGSW